MHKTHLRQVICTRVKLDWSWKKRKDGSLSEGHREPSPLLLLIATGVCTMVTIVTLWKGMACRSFGLGTLWGCGVRELPWMLHGKIEVLLTGCVQVLIPLQVSWSQGIGRVWGKKINTKPSWKNGTQDEVYRDSFTRRTVFPLCKDIEKSGGFDVHSFTTYDILNHPPEQLSSECPHCTSSKNLPRDELVYTRQDTIS